MYTPLCENCYSSSDCPRFFCKSHIFACMLYFGISILIKECRNKNQSSMFWFADFKHCTVQRGVKKKTWAKCKGVLPGIRKSTLITKAAWLSLVLPEQKENFVDFSTLILWFVVEKDSQFLYISFVFFIVKTTYFEILCLISKQENCHLRKYFWCQWLNGRPSDQSKCRRHSHFTDFFKTAP